MMLAQITIINRKDLVYFFVVENDDREIFKINSVSIKYGHFAGISGNDMVQSVCLVWY